MDWTSLVEQVAQGALDSNQRQQWNQTVGATPPAQFQQAATQAVQQVPPQQYASHMASGPIAGLSQGTQSSLASSLVSALLDHGASQQTLSQQTGTSTLDPSKLTPEQIASLLQYAHQNKPQALGQVATQYKDQPDVLHSIIGNKALLAVGAALGMGLFSGQIRKK